MRIPSELDSSLNVWYFLKQMRATEHFVFFTGHVSPHDEDIQKKTGERMIVKCQEPEKLEAFFMEIKEAKRRSEYSLMPYQGCIIQRMYPAQIELIAVPHPPN